MITRSVQSQFQRNTKVFPKCTLVSSPSLQQRSFISLFKQSSNIISNNTSNTSNNTRKSIWNFLSKRYYSPGSSYHELTPSAWREPRMWRYYKFSDKIDGM